LQVIGDDASQIGTEGRFGGQMDGVEAWFIMPRSRHQVPGKDQYVIVAMQEPDPVEDLAGALKGHFAAASHGTDDLDPRARSRPALGGPG